MTIAQPEIHPNIQPVAAPARVCANTLSSIRLDPQRFAPLPFAKFVDALLGELEV